MSPASPLRRSRRYLSLWLPRLPTDRLQRLVVRNRSRSGLPPPEAWPPLVVTHKQEGALRIVGVNDEAARAGLHAGMALAQAYAMCPALVVRPHDAAADGALLSRLADWLDRYTPLVGRTPPDGLMLDITGAAHLIGGERALVNDVQRRLADQGFTLRLALAGTPGCAHGLARFASRTAVVEVGEERAALMPLPVAALRIDTETAAGLARAGLKTIGDLMARPRSPLAARFGAFLLHRLDQALGIDGESIAPRGPVPPAMAEARLAEPIVREEDVSTVARQLAVTLAADLEARGEGARQLRLSVFRVDGAVRHVEVGLADPCRDAAVLHGLLALRLGNLADPLDPGYGYDLVRLAAPLTGPWSAEAAMLRGIDAAPDDAPRAARRLADRLSARFGGNHVLRLIAGDTHVPERASRLVPVAQAAAAPDRPTGAGPDMPSPTGIGGPRRPLRLFDPPEPVEIIAEVPDGPPLRLRWRRRSLKVSAAEGPERIALPWWSGAANTGGFSDLPRDYYRVSDETGRRLWIFREGPYVHPPDKSPRWFVHGLFG